MIISILIMVLTLSLLVFIHELGHFIAAKRSGVDVEEFGFGLPPRLYGVKRGGTILSVNWLPIGGFVRLKGENSATKTPGSFGAAKFGKQAKILLAGVAMNALLGFILLFYLASTGLPPIPNFAVDQTEASFAKPSQVLVLDITPDSAAKQAGLQKGDIVASGNGQSFSKTEELKVFTLAHAGQSVKFEIVRKGQNLTQDIKLHKGTKEGGQLGVLPFETYLLRYSPVKAVVVSAKLFGQIAAGTVAGFGRLIVSIPHLIGSLFSKAVPTEATAVGPVGITSIISNILFLGWRYIALIVVSITVSLAVINSFPIPALDGGRLAMLAITKLAGKELSHKVESVINSVGFVALILLIILITYFDIRRII